MPKFKVYYRKPLLRPRDEAGLVPASFVTREQTHVFLREVDALDLDDVFLSMQGEVWSPNGEARGLIRGRDLDHTSMSIGDALVDEQGRVFVAVAEGFREVPDAPPALSGSDAHPLPVGSVILSRKGERDCGAMSWDDTDTEVERRTGPDAEGVVVSRDWYSGQGWTYGVTFEPSEVQVFLDEKDFRGKPGDYVCLRLGDGDAEKVLEPMRVKDHRDPEVVRQIAEAGTGPNLS